MYTLFNRLVRETLSEAGNRKFSKGKASKPSLKISGTRIMSTPEPRPGVGKECVAVYIQYVLKDNAKDLAAAINTAVPGHVLWAEAKPNDKYNRLVIYINTDAKKELPTVTAKLEDAINSLGVYNEKSVTRIGDTLFDYVDNFATEEDKATALQNRVNNWQDMLQKLNDPEVRKRLLRYQMTNDYGRTYGHVLSSRNIRSILQQFPTASFVCEKYTWESKFNRTLAPGAQPIIVNRPSYIQPTMDELDMAAQMYNCKDYQEARRKFHNSPQVMGNIRIMAAGGYSKLFVDVKMYDVSQTIPPEDPADDVWTNEIGLSDNLMGVINSSAVEYDKNLSPEEQLIAQKNQEVVDTYQQEAMQRRRAALAALCQKSGVDLRRYNDKDDAEFIIRGSFRYALKLLPQYGIIHPNEINKLAAMVTIPICLTCGIETFPSRLTNLMSMGQATQADAMTVLPIASEIIDALSNAVRPPAQKITKLNTEGIMRRNKNGITETKDNEPLSVEEYIQMCKERFAPILGVQERQNHLNSIIQEEVRRAFRKLRK